MARYILFALIVVLVVWLVVHARRRVPPPHAKPPAPQDMVACQRCGVHLPRADALPGKEGVFCSAEHRREHEQESAG